MIGQPSNRKPALDLPGPMAEWQQRLFNWLARWEEASLARSLGLPAERVNFVELSGDDD